jgi:hypothetical protein
MGGERRRMDRTGKEGKGEEQRKERGWDGRDFANNNPL